MKTESFSGEGSPIKTENEHAEDLEDLYERLGAELERFWRQKIDPEIASGNKTYRSACEQLEEILGSRKKALNTPVRLHETPFGKESSEIIIPNIIESITRSRRRENLVGEGTVADVFRLEENPQICIKIIKNFPKYALGNTVHAEADFMEDLSDFEESGVRTPGLIASYSFPTHQLMSIAMETLDADTVWSTLSTRTPHGERFDAEDYFGRVQNYLAKMHKDKGIYHFDLHLRNLLIDRQTGLPRIIDFGASARQYFSGLAEEEEKRDRLSLETSKKEVRGLLKTIYNK